MINKYYKIYKSEAGFYLPLLGIVTATLVTFLSIYAVDKVKSNRLNLSLQKAIDDICYRTTTEATPMLQGQAAIEFQQSIQSLVNNKQLYGLNINNLQIVQAKLIIPAWNPNMIRNHTALRFNHLLGSSRRCILDNNEDCFLITNVYDYATKNSKQFGYLDLLKIWNSHDPSADIGSKTFCEISATYQTMLSQTKKVRVYAAEHLAPRNIRSNLASNLSLVIAPEFSTKDPNIPSRFDFQNFDKPDAIFNAIATEAYNTNVSDLANVFEGNAEDDQAVTSYNYNESGTITQIPITNPSLLGSASDILKSKLDLIQNCSNPATVIRNTFNATILELASRHGPSRLDTTALIIPPQHTRPVPGITNNQIINLGNLTDNYGTMPGADWHIRRHTLPYLYYIDDLMIEEEDAFAKPPDEPIVTPFSSYRIAPSASSQGQRINSDPQISTIHAFASNQLRYCYHLYHRIDNDGLTSSYIKRLPIPGIAGPYEEDPANPGMEVARFKSAPASDSIITTPNLRGWGSAVPFNFNSSTGSDDKFLTLTEAISILGTVQHCPSENIRSRADRLNGYCSKQTPGDVNEIRPDYIGLGKYLNGAFDLELPHPSSSNTVSLSSPTGTLLSSYLALRVKKPYMNFALPGALPIVLSNQTGGSLIGNRDLQHPMLPFGFWSQTGHYLLDASIEPTINMISNNLTGPYTFSEQKARHVLLVTHRAPADEVEADRIYSELYYNRASTTRTFTLVFIPTYGDGKSVTDQAKLLKRAFFNRDNANYSQALLFSDPILIFSPWHSKKSNNDKNFDFGEDVHLTESEQYRRYWRYMLNFRDNPDNNIVEEAKRLFVMRLLRREKIL